MNTRKHRYPLPQHLPSRLLVAGLLVFLFFLAACNASVPPAPPSVTPNETTPVTTTPTSAPSPTPTPDASRVILLAPPGHDEAAAEQFEDVLGDLADGEGLRFETVANLNPSDLQQGVQLVVALPPDSGISELANASPDIQFLAIGIPDLEAGNNISTINATGSSPDQIGFAAGYLAAVITEDWRVGVLSEQDTPEGDAVQRGYTNGVVYFCGLCRPVYPPFPIPGYPLAAQVTDVSGQPEWQAALANLKTWNVGTVFVDPGIASEGLYQEIADAGMNIIGTGDPPSGLQDHWVASLEAGDPIEAVKSLWPDLMAGKGGSQVNVALNIQSVNPDLFSPGRQALVEEMLSELSQGYIDTGANLSSGEPGN